MKIQKINDFKYKIKKDGKMNVDVIIYANKEILDKMMQDNTLNQAVNVASLPGVISALVMPDGHEGYGFPIGGVGVFDIEEGVVSPGGIGYDINCGVRFLTSNLSYEDIKEDLKEILNKIFSKVPSGVGRKGKFNFNRKEFLDAVSLGIDWAIEQGYATKKDKEHIEDFGRFECDIEKVSDRAIARGFAQLGSLGAGNHFLEIQKIEKIFDEKIAKEFGLKEGNIGVMIHTGSRGFGHQIASDYIKIMLKAAKKYNISLPDPELAAAPLKSKEAEDYLLAMGCAINFAFLNRQLISFAVREVFEELYGEKLELLYDVAHNIGKFEKHNEEVFIHRKGATRAFGKRKELPGKFAEIGQPVLIPGSMGTASYILLGLGNKESFESTCHGAGRVMSRSKAKKKIWGKEVKKRLEMQGILVKSADLPVLAEEAPEVYKDIDRVVEIVEKNNISKIISRNVPIGVVKG